MDKNKKTGIVPKKSKILKDLLYSGNKNKSKIEKIVKIEMSQTEEEHQQSLHRMNNKQKMIDVAQQKILQLHGVGLFGFIDSLNVGIFFVPPTKGFDYSIIISNDNSRENWYMINLTKFEIIELTKKVYIGKIDLTKFHSVISALKIIDFELLLTFKNANKQYNTIDFNFEWVGMSDIMDDNKIDSSTLNWKLNYT